MSQTIRLVSPCLGVCEFEEEEPKRCQGCKRTAEEVGAWRYATFDQRIELLTTLFERWQADGAPAKSDKNGQLLHQEMMDRFRIAGFLA